MKGKVKYFDNTKGYGFITVEGQSDIFVQYTWIKSDGYKTLEKNQEVTFETKQGDKGLIAINVESV